MRKYKSIPRANEVNIDIHNTRRRNAQDDFKSHLAINSMIAANDAKKRKNIKRFKIGVAIIVAITTIRKFFNFLYKLFIAPKYRLYFSY